MSCGYLKVCYKQSDMTGWLENDMSAEYEELKHLFAPQWQTASLKVKYFELYASV
jgi:hypothetical protein